MIEEEYAMMRWMDYTADMLGAIQFGLVHMGDKHPPQNVKLYSDIAHQSRRKRATDNMSARQIIGYIASKL